MSETFNFKRFSTYFSYDLTQMWRNKAMTALLLGGGGLIFFLFYVSCNLTLFQHLKTPDLASRAGIFMLCVFLFNLFTTRTYGFLTDKKKGADFLMVPASTLEKFLSMIIMTIIVLPLLFILTYLCIDAILCLCFPLSGECLFQAAGELSIKNFLVIHVHNMLYYLFCGLVFKRNKIFWSIAIGIIIGILFSLFGISGLMDNSTFSQDDILQIVAQLKRTGGILIGAGIVVLACGVYYRLKTIMH